MISYDEFVALAQDVYRKVREEFKRKTEGLLFASKVMLQEELIASSECVYDEDVREALVFGRFDAIDHLGFNAPSFVITIFYDSFAKEFPYHTKAKLKERLFETILHEILHYYEANLGRRELSKIDLEFKRVLMERNGTD